ncbi:hypothetical protein [Streptomyces barkulensis]|uniref:hypothetical protein n=1 Tax=Streptomyces barkulensis TaxID=1257026 RepID=UPI00117D5165|nr:hypothetical protein [Streptomyces barkulensis]
MIETDSAPTPASAEKLLFARDAGAFPLRVRFGKGSIETEKSRGTAQAGGARTAEQAARPGARPTAGAPPYRRCAGTTARQAPTR